MSLPVANRRWLDSIGIKKGKDEISKTLSLRLSLLLFSLQIYVNLPLLHLLTYLIFIFLPLLCSFSQVLKLFRHIFVFQKKI